MLHPAESRPAGIWHADTTSTAHLRRRVQAGVRILWSRFIFVLLSGGPCMLGHPDFVITSE